MSLKLSELNLNDLGIIDEIIDLVERLQIKYSKGYLLVNRQDVANLVNSLEQDDWNEDE